MTGCGHLVVIFTSCLILYITVKVLAYIMWISRIRINYLYDLGFAN